MFVTLISDFNVTSQKQNKILLLKTYDTIACIFLKYMLASSVARTRKIIHREGLPCYTLYDDLMMIAEDMRYCDQI